MLDSGVCHQLQKPGADAVLGSWNTELRHDFMRIDPVDHSSSNWLVVPYQGYCITTTSGTTITALGVEIRWKASDLLLYDPNSPGMAEQVSTTAVPAVTVMTTANPRSPGMAEQASTMAVPEQVSTKAAPTKTDITTATSTSPGMAERPSTMAMPEQISTTAAPTRTFITATTITISQAGESDTHKLGTAAEIGMGVGGATLVLICFASLIAFLFLRKRRTLDTRPGLANHSASSAPELAYNWARSAYNEPIELRAKPKANFRTFEIDSNPLLEAYNGPVELRAISNPNSRKFEIDSNPLSELR